MAFRRTHLLALGGFDPQFRVAGDDVDICWRVLENGWKLGFCPTATVFHHRRDTLQAYWKQQCGYGKAEALLERKWPDKYNAAGHLTWGGRVYNARGLTPLWWSRGRIYHGSWGSAPYQRLYQPAVSILGDLPLLPEWYLVIGFLALLSMVGLVWRPLLAMIPVLVLALGCTLLLGATNAVIASSCSNSKQRKMPWRGLAIGTFLHLMHPLARLYGRLKYGLHPWRRRGVLRPLLLRARIVSVWAEEWKAAEDWLHDLQLELRQQGAIGFAGGGYDNWDLEIQGGMLGGVRTRMAIEEHGSNRQMLRFKIWPRCATIGALVSLLMVGLAVTAAFDHAPAAAAVLGAIGLLAGGRLFLECALAMHNLTDALRVFETQATRSGATSPEPVMGSVLEHSR